MKKKLLVLLLIMLLPFMVNAKTNYLYDVIKDEAESNGLAREYTGEHQDSLNPSLSTKPIYYWYASTSSKATTILNKNNVIFADHCWQMIRTTDTGGVKLLYNGEAVDGKCLTTRGNHVTYGTGQYHATRHPRELRSTYYYGSSYSYDASTGKFKLSGNIATSAMTADSFPSLKGKYTCLSTSSTATCKPLYVVESFVSNNNANVLSISDIFGASGLGLIEFNEEDYTLNPVDGSLSYAGYMYNKAQRHLYLDFSSSIRMLDNNVLKTTHWFADDIVYNETTNKWTLSSPYKVNSSEEYANLVGKYTFMQTNETYSSSSVMYIVGVSGSTAYYLSIPVGKTINELNNRHIYGDTFILNNDGTYTIPNYNTIYTLDWFENGQNTSKKYICKATDDNKCETIIYVSGVSYNSATGIDPTKNYKYASSFRYENGKYYLEGESITFWDVSDLNNTNNLKNYHYTCWNENGECENISYVYYKYVTANSLYYVTLKNGAGIENYLNDMLWSEDINQIDSTIKNATEFWYERYLLDYTKYIEDVIYCNDRSLDNIGGFNPDGGGIYGKLTFKHGFKCANITDMFSVSNEKAKLNYPIGLMTYPEMVILGDKSVRKSFSTIGGPENIYYWLMTPAEYNSSSSIYYVSSDGRVASDLNHNAYARNTLKPAISLKPKTRYVSGDGSQENPYIIDYNEYYSVNVEIKNETKDLNIEIDDLTSVSEGENVTFKVTPIKGYQVNNIEIKDSNNNEIDYEETSNNNEYTFVMPANDVTIIPSYEKVSNAVEVEDNKNTKEITIEVNDVKAVVYEETVKFTVIPEDGYELENIIITDEEGNNISYKKTKKENEYEFTMPDTDVLIKPVYKKIEVPNNTSDNPKTGKSYLFVFLILILGLVTILKHKKRLN